MQANYLVRGYKGRESSAFKFDFIKPKIINKSITTSLSGNLVVMKGNAGGNGIFNV